MGPIKRPSDRDLTREDIPAVVGVLAVVATFIVLAAIGHPVLAAAVLGGAMFVAFAQMPRQQREAIGREIRRRDRTPLGRAFKVVEILGGLLVIYVLAKTALAP